MSKTLLSIIIGSSLVLISVVGYVFPALVAFGDVACGGDKCYGGKIKQSITCTCPYNYGTMLEIDDKSSPTGSLKIFYDPLKSKLRARNNIWQAGPEVLGAYTPPNRDCEMEDDGGCSYYDTTKGTIDKVKGISTTAN